MIVDKICSPSDVALWGRNELKPMLRRLADLYATMDRFYAEAASHYGFQCDGCRDNCCQTRFYHHTVIEYLYLMKGVYQLSPDTRQAVRSVAAGVVEGARLAGQPGQKRRLMCPLNREQRCIIYPFRPMICRLHGISHELRRNDGTILLGEGCQLFDEHALGKPYFRFDRTPFYSQMVILEKDVRVATGITRRLKMTIAEMLITEDFAAHSLE
jgi:Fe-S-cluster containining protein